MISFSAFIYRDIVRYIVPTALALALLLPTISLSFDLNVIILGAILLGYVATDVVGNAYGFFIEKLSLKWRDLEARKIENAKRWDYDKLFYALSVEERDYLYLTNSYVTLYLVISAYLLAYSAGNLVYLVNALYENVHNWKTLTTCLLGNLQINTAIVIAISSVASRQAFNDYLTEYNSLHNHKYPHFASLYHQKKGMKIATSIWGKLISMENEPLANINLEINAETKWSAITDKKGAFHFSDCYSKLENKTLILSIALSKATPINVTITLKPNTVPELTVYVDQKSGNAKVIFE
jgi:hypothetical protein